MRLSKLSLGPFVLFLLSATGLRAQSGFTTPTPVEMNLRAEPSAPGAPAVVLSYEETDDGPSAEVSLHVRLKVLTAGGLDAGTIELPERIVSNDEFDRTIAARTIHADGSVVEFKATPQNSRVVEDFSGRPRRLISLPQVEVGSILEYTCHFAGQNTLYTYLTRDYAPTWRVQGKYFTRAAHFSLKLPSFDEESTTRWVAHLPLGAQVVRNKGRVTLDLTDIPAAPEEDFMPPATAVLYGVRFFYYNGKRDDYWGKSGGSVDDDWSDFLRPSKPVTAAAHALAPPGETDEARLRKLYIAVQKLENTDLTREHTAREDKRTSVNSEVIWQRRRGTSQELTLLFVALARAAGFKAYPMAVASRDHAIFDQDVLSWSQMDSLVAIVESAGRDIYFDPGTRLCSFATLAPWHSGVMGVSVEDKLIKIRLTPAGPFTEARTERAADLTLTPTGALTGTIKIAWLSNAGLSLRRLAVREDQHAVETALEKEYGALVPSTVALKLESLQHLDNTDDPDVPLVATFSVTGSLGVASPRRIALPAQLFVAQAKPQLAPETRTAPVAFPAAYVTRDQVILHLPAELSVETLPGRKTYNIATEAVYDDNVTAGKGAVIAQRTFILSKVDYAPGAYTALHKFFAAVAGADQEQVILTRQPAARAE